MVKISRELTQKSKKVIFLLQRQKPNENLTEALSKCSALVLALSKHFVANSSDQFLLHTAFTSGLQEFVEAVLFYFYLKDGAVASPQQIHSLICQTLPSTDQQPAVCCMLFFCVDLNE